MSLGLFKRTSKSKEIHRYENVPASSHRHESKQKQSRKHDTDYINVEFEDRNGSRHLAMLGGATRTLKESSIDSDLHALASETTSSIDSTNSTDGVMQHDELVKSNKLELNKSSKVYVGKSHTCRVHHRMNSKDSDSSSSEIVGSSESPDAKKRELEHYNRLKLNLSCLQHNKKLLKGIRILYNDAVLVDEKQQNLLQTALDSSKLYKQWQQYSAAEETSSTQEVKEHQPSISSKKYKKEGHTNQILSVTGRPISSSASRTRSSSRSIGDVDKHENVGTEINRDSSDLSTPALSKSKLSQSQTKHFAERESTQLSVSGKAETPTLSDTMRPLHINNQVSQYTPTHTEPSSATSNLSGIHFTNAVETITIDHNGGQFALESHDIWFTVPKGAIKKHTVAELQVQVMLHGPFSFPGAKRPVSPIIWFYVNPKIKLKNPIEITVAHFMENKGQTIKDELVFLKTTDGVKALLTGKTSGIQYKFSRVPENNQQFNTDNCGTLLTKDSCFFCIAGDTSNDSRLTANYCLVPVIPRTTSQTTWKIHYYVTYLLKTYIHMVQCQMGQEWEILSPRKFDFATVNGQKQTVLEIQFQRQLVDSGWILSLESNNKIQASDLHIWDGSETKMKVLEPIGMYPPRFTIRVHGEEARESSVATIHFSGASDYLTTEIPLMRPRMSIGTTNSSTPTSVFSPNQTSRSSSNSDSHHMISTCKLTSVHDLHCTCGACLQSLYKNEDYDHLPCMSEVDQTSIHEMDIPSDNELLQVATEIIKVLEDDWALLQAPLNIPDYIMLDVLSQTTKCQQVLRLLKEWRTHTANFSKENLGRCLYQADKRLQHIGLML